MCSQSQPAKLVDTVPTLTTSYCHISCILSISFNWATSCKCTNNSYKSRWADGKLTVRRMVFASFTGNGCIINYSSMHVQVTQQYHVPGSKTEEGAFGTDEIERFFRDNPQVVEKGIDSLILLVWLEKAKYY